MLDRGNKIKQNPTEIGSTRALNIAMNKLSLPNASRLFKSTEVTEKSKIAVALKFADFHK